MSLNETSSAPLSSGICGRRLIYAGVACVFYDFSPLNETSSAPLSSSICGRRLIYGEGQKLIDQEIVRGGRPS